MPSAQHEANASELSVDLEWPDDPLAPSGGQRQHEELRDVAGRLDRVEAWLGESDGSGELSMDDLAQRLDYLGGEIIAALRTLHDTVGNLGQPIVESVDKRITSLHSALISALAARQTDDERGGQDREDLLAAVAATTEEIRGELEAIRRRVKLQPERAAPAAKRGGASSTGGGGMDEATMDELVMRVADELEIRLVAALKPAPAAGRKRR